MAHKAQTDLVLFVPCAEESPLTWVLDAQGRDTFRIVVRCRQAQAAIDPRKAPESLVEGVRHVRSLPNRREKQWWPLHRNSSLRRRIMELVRRSLKNTRQFIFIKAVLLTLFLLMLAWLSFLVLSAGLSLD